MNELAPEQLVPCIGSQTSVTHVAQAVTLHKATRMSHLSYNQLRTSSLAVPSAHLHKIIQDVMVDFNFTNSIPQFYVFERGRFSERKKRV